MKRVLQTSKFHFTYAEDTVDPADSHILWEDHCHARYEMIAVLEGDVTVMQEGRHFRLTDGQVMILPPLGYHAVTVNKKGVYRRLTVLFEPSSIPEILREDFTRRDAEPACFPLPRGHDVSAMGHWESLLYYEPLLESLMIRVFYHRLQAPAPRGEEGADGEFLPSITAYIDSHLEEQIRLEDLARHTARSASFVSHLFEEKMGIPPGQYILRKRMAYAQKLMVEGHSATEVAARLGYKSYTAFYRVYRKHCGVTPQASKSTRAPDS